MRLSYLIAQHRNKSLEPFVATSQLTNEFANHPVYLDMQLSSLPHKQLISLAISARGLKSTTIFRQKERNQAPTAGRKGVKNNKKSTAIVSDDSAIGVDESFDFTGDTPTTLVAQNNVFDQQRRFEAKLQQAGDPIALSVNFLPFRFVKGEPSGIEKPPVKSSFTAQIAAELPFFLKRQGSLLSQFSGCPSTSSIFRRRQYINDQGEEVEDEEVQAKPKLTKRFTDSNLHQYVRQKVNEELAIDQRQKFNKQRRSLDSFDENLNNNIDGKRVSSLLNNKLESALGAVAEKSKKKKKPLPKSSSSIAFSFAPSATNILASKKQQQVPNLAQPNGGSRLRSQSTSSSTTAKQSPLRKTLSPVPERRRKLRQPYSKAQKKPQHQQSQQNYTTNTTSSSLKRFDATPIKSRSYSPLLVRRRPSPKSAQTQPTKRRQLVRSSIESVDSPKQLKQKSQSKSKKATQRVKQSEKSVQAPETPVPTAKVDKVEELKKEVEKEEELKVEELNEYFEERFKERFKKDGELQARTQASPVTSANKENEPRESTASTKPVEDEQCPSKSPTESRNSATKSPAVAPQWFCCFQNNAIIYLMSKLIICSSSLMDRQLPLKNFRRFCHEQCIQELKCKKPTTYSPH
ncbi:hypothetical protein M3Y97_00633200 [Aphelenchoides bicaudatus]|nr:hypothetical protein M3Y97_00633200 [Aphelenchoides bicaudatus]